VALFWGALFGAAARLLAAAAFGAAAALTPRALLPATARRRALWPPGALLAPCVRFAVFTHLSTAAARRHRRPRLTVKGAPRARARLEGSCAERQHGCGALLAEWTALAGGGRRAQAAGSARLL
jgi:hypothetical protein